MPPYRSRGVGVRFTPYPLAQEADGAESTNVMNDGGGDSLNVDTTSVYIDGILDFTIPASERNQKPPTDWIKRTKITRYNIHLNDIVKIHKSGDYLQVKRIYQDPRHNHNFMLQGIRYRRMVKLPGGFNGFRNEVILMQEVYQDSVKSQSCGLYLETYTKDQLLPVKKKILTYTNHTREMIKHDRRQRGLSTNLHDPLSQDPERLWCRSKHTIRFDGRAASRKVTSKYKSWTRFASKDIPNQQYRVEDLLLRLQGRHERHSRNDISAGPAEGRGSYCLVDICCGAGFTSEGGRVAGFKVTWGCDNNLDATKTFAFNHRGANAVHLDFKDFIDRYGLLIDVDCLVISFPCQPWSPAHTVPGRNDDTNRAALLGLERILEVLRPRVVVLEQTFGLARQAHKEWLAAMLAMFWNTDYSVQMATLNFRGFGCDSDRKRMIFIAAAPGEALPNFPDPDTDISKPRSMFDLLRRPVANHPNHVRFLGKRNPDRVQFNPRTKFVQTITKSSPIPHWLGGNLTPHEGMRLIGAHDSYILKGESKTVQWGQVGNAFPPVVAAKILRKCRESLEDTDREDDRVDRNLREKGKVISLIEELTLDDRRQVVDLTRRVGPGVPFAGVIE
ncbi:Hypothetical protein D9617_32g091460 [Elsinoe fawcettii]|nr:Hypothetical protein D9617_32g091460 [Elsinoe fawcettii]